MIKIRKEPWDTKEGMNSNDYYYHPLLSTSTSVTEYTESHENVEQYDITLKRN
jgi:hypothetical protein